MCHHALHVALATDRLGTFEIHEHVERVANATDGSRRATAMKEDVRHVWMGAVQQTRQWQSTMGAEQRMLDSVGRSFGEIICVFNVLYNVVEITVCVQVHLNRQWLCRFAVITRRICQVVPSILGRVWLAHAQQN